MQRAAQLLGVLELAVLHPTMGCDEVEQLDHAGRIDLFATAKARLRRFLCISQIHKRDGQLITLQFFGGELFERLLRRMIYQLLQAERLSDCASCEQRVRLGERRVHSKHK